MKWSLRKLTHQPQNCFALSNRTTVSALFTRVHIWYNSTRALTHRASMSQICQGRGSYIPTNGLSPFTSPEIIYYFQTIILSYNSTAHSFMMSSNMNEMLRRIGQGFCGTVWASYTGNAHKREDGGPGRSLRNDYNMHQKAIESLSASKVRVPACYRYVGV